MKRHLAKTLSAFMVLTLVACGGSGGLQTPQVFGVDPCIAQSGDTVTIFGRHFSSGSTPTVTIDGVNCPVDTHSDTQAEVTLPAGISSGQVVVGNSQGTGFGLYNFTVGSLATIPEVEPNDNIKGLNATNAMGNRVVTGNLSSVSDKDHFRFEGLVSGLTYHLQIDPTIVTVVYVDGNPVNLNMFGYCEVSSSSGSILVDVTGGTGSYTATISLSH